jgi:hypothetical protein
MGMIGWQVQILHTLSISIVVVVSSPADSNISVCGSHQSIKQKMKRDTVPGHVQLLSLQT